MFEVVNENLINICEIILWWCSVPPVAIDKKKIWIFKKGQI